MTRRVGFGVLLGGLVGGGLATTCQPSRDMSTKTPTTIMSNQASPPAADGWFRPCAVSPEADPGNVTPAASAAVPAPTVAPPPANFRWPTNQWWTSLLTGAAQPLWAPPLVVQLVPDGIGIGVPIVGSSADAVISSPIVDLIVEVAYDDHRVTSFGDFHIVAELSSAGLSSAQLTVAQGSVATWVRTSSPTIDVGSGSIVSSFSGPIGTSPSPQTDHVWVEQADGQRWDLITSRPTTWTHEGAELASIGDDLTLGIVAQPTGADTDWADRAYESGLDPVIDTIAEWQVTPGNVRQRLQYRRLRNGAGAIAILPHQRHSLERGDPIPGTFNSHLGQISLQLSDSIEWVAPLPGVLLGTPAIGTTSESDPLIAGAVAAAATRAAAIGSMEPAGSYFGPKELGRLASILDVATATSSQSAASLQKSLTERLDRWLTESEPPDDRWLGYDPVWGGISASSPEFGHEDYNDHHFQFGYLLQAAATVAERDPSVVARWKPMIDLIIADLGLVCRAGFPRYRVVNPFLGHSVAAGMVPFIDGVNQESSSEAVHAWWSIARWAAATGDSTLATAATALYAMEANSARFYWLGEVGDRPVGYAHDVAGIVWGGKIDFATFFDARPASIVGIQLLPFSFGSLYRSDPTAAQRRYTSGSIESGSRWQDLLALDLALDSPPRARAIIDDVSTSTEGFEEGLSEAFARYWVSSLERLGRPDNSVASTPPLGVAFTASDGTTHFVAVNPTAAPLRVSFTRNGDEIAIVDVPARSSAIAS